MKILIFNNAGLTIQEEDFCVDVKTGEFANELKNLGHSINFYGQMLPFTKNTISAFRIKENGMSVTGIKRKRLKLINYTLLYLNTIPIVLKHDFIYIFYPNSLRFVAFIAILLNKKYGLYIRGINNLKDRTSHVIYKRASSVFTVADSFTEYVNKVADIQIANTIRPMISFTNNDIIRNRKYESKNIYQLLFLGRMTNDKGIIELLHALQKLKNTDFDFLLKLVGDGDYMEDLKELSRLLGLSKNVSFEGGVYNPMKIQQYYTEADLYILPTYHGEGFPRTLYEAMIFGTPIITTFVGGISGLMRDNFNCLEIEPRSTDSLFEVLYNALKRYPLLAELAENGRNTIESVLNTRKLSHAQDVNRYLEIFKDKNT